MLSAYVCYKYCTFCQILKVILHRASCHPAHVMLANVIAFNHDMIWPHSLSGVHLTAQ